MNMICVRALYFVFFVRFDYSIDFVYFLLKLCIVNNGSSVIIMKKFQLIFVYIEPKGCSYKIGS